ncbi:DUF4422 domain-containing protein [Lachnospiraceae bacterium C1.1]|nr:DUF4422 domain-containing protein [Lachnospiraceae bacterium C1.1]
MIYIMTHKKFDDSFIDKEHYRILHVGPNDNCKDDYLRDDCGDNISFKNKNFCELTGLYWIWKNAPEKASEITGLVHYRRFFTDSIGDLLYTYFNIKPRILPYEKLEARLRDTDIILPMREHIVRTLRQYYADIHVEEDLDITRKALEKLYPDYLTAFDEVMESHKYYYANMMICKRELLNKYCEWLFAIMDELEKDIDIAKYAGDKYQERVFGFISERLLQVWVLHKKLKVAEIPAFNTEERRMGAIKKTINRTKKLFGIKTI